MEKETLRFDETTFFTKQSDSNGIGNIPQLAIAIRSSDKNIQIPALKSLLNIVVNVPESVEALYENDVVSVLNKYIGGAQEGEIYVLSSTILHVIGVRSKVEDSSVRAGAATESLIQIIHSSNEKESKSGSKALCELVEENSQIRNSLLSTGFAQVVLHTLTSNTQIETKSSSSSSPENSTPIFVKIGLLNVILKLSEEEKGLESLIVLIPALEELKSNGENQLKSKAKNLLLILSQIKGINSQNSNSKSNLREKDQKIQQMEESNKHLNEELRIKDEELLQIGDDRDKEKQRADQAEQRYKREEQEKQRKEEENQILKAEIDQMKKNIEKLKTKQETQKKESSPSQDVDGIMKKISKKNIKDTSVSLTQILENGIWQMEAEFNNSWNLAAIGIVRDTYNIPADTHPCDNPHRDHIVSYGLSGFGFGNGAVYYKGNGTKGNILYKDNQKIKAEFDSEKGTLIFSVDGVQQPVYVRGINEKVRFIITISYAQQSCTIRSLKKLIAPTTKHVANEIAVQW
ncbi:MAG: hypothetical protein EZS28_020424 [Streblomastix strix]|uniref:B30.2/SPRY domain-containing protein n=1 Tax=Streblomastix strix TaxID=222440 RepID=A0A5J4VP24_9EUKA|nr:MAG: hypothetical protein EZS28_020424 [Streblomastix strix]